MRVQPKPIYYLVLLAAVTIMGCPPPPALPPALVGCGPVTASVMGKIGFGSLAPSAINTTANVNDTGTSVTWQVPSKSTGTVIDGVNASGTIPAGAPRTFTATGTSGSHTLTVTGTITGPPPPCTGKGSWTVTITESGQVVGRGSWSIP